ncbi:MAG: lysophospholipid acyltransferase family protein [Anaerolineae bacterium]|jgi:1-acyl-sn-glycerol-3-phosphate acyltransferase
MSTKDGSVPESSPFFVRLAVTAFRVVFKVYFRLECEGCEHVREVLQLDRPVISVLNHASNLDAAVAAACTGPEFVIRSSAPGKRELFDNWKTGWFMRALGFFPVDRDILDLTVVRTMFRILRSGRGIGIAPEGTRSPTGEVQQFKSGFVKLALKVDAPILPIGIEGAHEALPKGAVFPRPKKLTVRFGELIDLKRYIAEQPKVPTDEELAEMVRQEVVRLSGGVERSTEGS